MHVRAEEDPRLTGECCNVATAAIVIVMRKARIHVAWGVASALFALLHTVVGSGRKLVCGRSAVSTFLAGVSCGLVVVSSRSGVLATTTGSLRLACLLLFIAGCCAVRMVSTRRNRTTRHSHLPFARSAVCSFSFALGSPGQGGSLVHAEVVFIVDFVVVIVIRLVIFSEVGLRAGASVMARGGGSTSRHGPTPQQPRPEQPAITQRGGRHGPRHTQADVNPSRPCCCPRSPRGTESRARGRIAAQEC